MTVFIRFDNEIAEHRFDHIVLRRSTHGPTRCQTDHDFVKVRPVALPPVLLAGRRRTCWAASSVTLPTSGGPSAWSRARVPSLKPAWPVEGLLLALGVDLPGELAVCLERQRDRQSASRLGLPGADQAGRRRGRGGSACRGLRPWPPGWPPAEAPGPGGVAAGTGGLRRPRHAVVAGPAARRLSSAPSRTRPRAGPAAGAG